MNTWPDQLPRFAEAFRVFIDDPQHKATRLLTGEWQMACLWTRVSSDFLPRLALAGRISIIATTAPRYHSDYSTKEWYGDTDYPVIYWHPDAAGNLSCISGEASIADYCRRRRVARDLFDKPIHSG